MPWLLHALSHASWQDRRPVRHSRDLFYGTSSLWFEARVLTRWASPLPGPHGRPHQLTLVHWAICLLSTGHSRGNSLAHRLQDSSPGLYPQYVAWLGLPTPLKPYLSTGMGTLLGKKVCHTLPDTVAVTVDLVFAGRLSHLSQVKAVAHRLHSGTCPTS